MSNILSALQSISAAEVSYQDWINVGMALKAEGYDFSVWDAWSRNDPRYKPGECARKWDSFRGNSAPVMGGTIVQMARDRGWKPSLEDGVMGWEDSIQDDGDDFTRYTAPPEWDQVADFAAYLETIFEPDDLVSYVSNDVWQDSEGKWLPSKGVYDRTAEELLASLKKHPDDLGATLGDWKPEAGAWIRFNPVDGEGVRNDNITKFRYALVESDANPTKSSNTKETGCCIRKSLNSKGCSRKRFTVPAGILHPIHYMAFGLVLCGCVCR